MKITKSQLIKLIKEEMASIPYEPEVHSNATRISKTSLDDQVDSYLLNYERMSLQEESSDADQINESLNNASLSTLLEADGEEESLEDLGSEMPPTANEPPAEGGAGNDDDIMVDAEDMTADEPAEEPVPLIDIDQFVQRVARLATRPEHLLDLKTAIINRALKFLGDNYTETHVEKAQDILSNNFDFDFDTQYDNEPEVPVAYGSGGTPSGGLGSGGA